MKKSDKKESSVFENRIIRAKTIPKVQLKRALKIMRIYKIKNKKAMIKNRYI